MDSKRTFRKRNVMSVNTGIFLRLKREGKMANVLIEDHTEEELADLIDRFMHKDDMTGADIAQWVFPICKALKISEDYRAEIQQSILDFKKGNSS